MKVSTILAALLTLVLVPSAFAKKPKPSAAPASSFSKYDKNGNGILDADEKEAVKTAIATDSDLKKYDTNSDGKLDGNELAAIKPSEAAKKKKKR
jgi:Ca2+-binding EF-hand superfamily protein